MANNLEQSLQNKQTNLWQTVWFSVFDVIRRYSTLFGAASTLSAPLRRYSTLLGTASTLFSSALTLFGIKKTYKLPKELSIIGHIMTSVFLQHLDHFRDIYQRGAKHTFHYQERAPEKKNNSVKNMKIWKICKLSIWKSSKTNHFRRFQPKRNADLNSADFCYVL